MGSLVIHRFECKIAPLEYDPGCKLLEINVSVQGGRRYSAEYIIPVRVEQEDFESMIDKMFEAAKVSLIHEMKKAKAEMKEHDKPFGEMLAEALLAAEKKRRDAEYGEPEEHALRMNHCSQCGGPLDGSCCGPTHAVLQAKFLERKKRNG